MLYVLQLRVEINPASTPLKALEQAELVARELRLEVSRGLLTRAAPQTIVNAHEISILHTDDSR